MPSSPLLARAQAPGLAGPLGGAGMPNADLVHAGLADPSVMEPLSLNAGRVYPNLVNPGLGSGNPGTMGPGMMGPGTAPSRIGPQVNARQGAGIDMRVNDVVGAKLMDGQDHTLGTVKDLVLLLPSAQSPYAIVQFDNPSGGGGKTYAIPTRLLQPAGQQGPLIYRGRRPGLLGAAAIFDTEWGQDPLQNRNLWARIDQVWQQPRHTVGGGAVLASRLLKDPVKNASGRTIGEIRTVVVNLPAERVHYAVLEFDPSWLAPEHKVALPVQALHGSSAQGGLRVDLTRFGASRLPELDRNWYQRMNEPQFVTTMDRYLVTSAPSFMGAQAAGPVRRASAEPQVAAPLFSGLRAQTRCRALAPTWARARAADLLALAFKRT